MDSQLRQRLIQGYDLRNSSLDIADIHGHGFDLLAELSELNGKFLLFGAHCHVFILVSKVETGASHEE